MEKRKGTSLSRQAKSTSATSSAVIQFEDKANRISAFDNKDQWETLTHLIYLSAKSIGVLEDKMPVGVEMKVLVLFIKENYSDFTLSEVQKAFDHAAIEEIQHFQSINKNYIAQILNAYKKFRAKCVREENIKEEKRKTNHDLDNRVTGKQRDENDYNTCVKIVKKLKTIPMTCPWVGAFNHAKNTGLLNYDKGKVQQEVKNMLEDQAGKTEGTALDVHSAINEATKGDEFLRECKRYVIKGYFANNILNA